MAQSLSLPVVVAIALGSGVAGGLVAHFAAPSPKGSKLAASAEPANDDVSSAADTGDDRRALERRVAALELKLAQSERAGRLAAAARAYGSALADDGTAPTDGGARGPVVDDPVFEAAVRDIVDQVRDEQRSEWQRRRDERRQQAITRWTTELGSELSLTEDQKKKIAEIAQKFFDDLRALRDADGGPTNRNQWRDKIRDLRAQSDKKLGGVLDPSQKQKYDELDEDKKLGSGFGGGGRRGRRGGGSGGPGAPGGPGGF